MVFPLLGSCNVSSSYVPLQSYGNFACELQQSLNF